MKTTKIFTNKLKLISLIILFFSVLEASATSLEQKRLLQVKSKHVQMKLAETNYERTQTLFKLGGVGQMGLDKSLSELDQSQISFQQSLLDLFDSQPKLLVEKAEVYKDERGQHFIDLVIKNATLILDSAQTNMLANFGGDNKLPDDFMERRLQNVYVSISDVSGIQSLGGSGNNGVSIALPYEQLVDELSFGETKSLSFKLLKNAKQFNVNFSYRSVTHSIGIYAEQKMADMNIELISSQITQEADLGTVVNFPIEVARTGQDTKTVQLHLYNLPKSIRYSFIDPKNNTRVSQIRLSTGETSRELQLKLNLPEKYTNGFHLDKPIPFIVAAFDTKNSLNVPEPGSLVSKANLEKLPMALTDFNLIARGIGELEFNASSLAHKIEPGGNVNANFIIKNKGSRTIDNINFDSEYPSQWGVAFEPKTIASLDVGEEIKVKVYVNATDSAIAGDFEVRVKAEAFSANRALTISDKIYRLTVKKESSALPGIIIFLLFVGVVLLVVYIGKKVRIR